MDVALVLEIMVLGMCAVDMIVLARQRRWRSGAFYVRAALLAAATVAYYRQGTPSHPTPGLEYLVAAAWFYLIIFPRLLDAAVSRLRISHWYTAAVSLAWMRTALIPYPSGSAMLHGVRAMKYFDLGRGDLALAEMTRVPMGPLERRAVEILYGRDDANVWTDLLAHLNGMTGEREFARNPSIVYYYIRALGETGDLEGLIAAYARFRGYTLVRSRQTGQLARLVFLAFTGQTAWLRRLVTGPMRVLPPSQRQFWIATAELAAGDEQGRRDLEALAATALSPPMRRAVNRRLDHPPVRADQVLLPFHDDFIHEVEQELSDEEEFVTGPSGRRAWVTQTLILANFAMFYLEYRFGGTTNERSLTLLGAVSPESLRQGDYWRVVAANFLHEGWLHIAMNMLALSILGPFVERTLGALAYFFMYMASGIGAIYLVTRYLTPNPVDTLVGASAAIMGLVGAMAAVYLRARLRHGNLRAKNRLRWVAAILIGQFAFDHMVPNISDSAHMIGCGLGFVITSLLPYNKPPTPTPAVCNGLLSGSDTAGVK